MTAVGDGRLDEDPAVSVGAVGVGGGDMESGALLQTVRNKPKTRGGQRIRTRSPCREKRVHASELPTTNSYPAGHASFSELWRRRSVSFAAGDARSDANSWSWCARIEMPPG